MSACRVGRKSRSREFAKAIELEPCAIIPFEPKLFGTAANNGQMLAEIEPTSKIVEMFDDLARLLMGARTCASRRRVFWGRCSNALGARRRASSPRYAVEKIQG